MSAADTLRKCVALLKQVDFADCAESPELWHQHGLVLQEAEAVLRDGEKQEQVKLHAEYAPRAMLDVAPEPFIVGNQYRTQGGRMVRFIGIANEGNSYETMFDELGHHRYTRRDFGRGTGAPLDDDCVPPLYTYPAMQPAAAPSGDVKSDRYKPLVVAVREAILTYYDALSARQHGGVAQDKALSTIQEAFGMCWQPGVDHRAITATKE